MDAFIKLCDKQLSKVEDLFAILGGLGIFGLMLLGVGQVVVRNIFNSSIVGYIDVVELSIATYAFLGAAYCQRLGGHIRMELLMINLRGRKLWMVESFGSIVGLFMVGVVGWYGWGHFVRAYTLGDTTIDIELVIWPSKLLVPVAFFVWFLRILLQLVEFVRLVREPSLEPLATPSIKTVKEQAAAEIKESQGS